MPPSPLKPVRHIDTLTGVRAFAAFWVVLFHFNLLETPFRGRLGTVVQHGSFGVDLFFVLSGFVLSLVYADKLPAAFNWAWYGNFLKRRLAKIYPAHLLTLAGMIALVETAAYVHYNFTQGAENTPRNALYSFLMVHAWGFTSGLSWNRPSWSVSAEWFAYAVLFAPMVFALRRVRTVWLIAVAVAILALMPRLMSVFGGDWTRATTLGAVRILPEFFCGYVLYRLLRRRTLRGGDLWMAAGVALLVLCSFMHDAIQWLLVPAVMILIAGLSAGGRFTDLVFANRYALVLGEASYSIYLMQDFVIIGTKQTIRHIPISNGTPMLVLTTLSVLAVSSMVGIALNRWFEEPVRLAILRYFERPNKNIESLSVQPDMAQETSSEAA